MGFFNSVGDFFSKAANTVSSGFNQVAPKVQSVASTVYNDVTSVFSFAGRQVEKATDLPNTIIKGGQQTIQTAGSVTSGLGKDVVSLGSSLL